MNPSQFLALAAKTLADVSDGNLSDQQLSKVHDTIIGCSVTAAINPSSSVLVDPCPVIPLPSSVVASSNCSVLIRNMYTKINDDLDISIMDNVPRSIASIICNNVVTITPRLSVAHYFSYVPILGSIGFSAFEGKIGYMTVFASGVLYIKLLTKIMKANGSFDISGSDEELQTLVKDLLNESNVENHQ